VKLVNGQALASVTVLLPRTTPAGTYTLTISGDDGSLTNTATAKIHNLS
jgi:hypothetical protein